MDVVILEHFWVSPSRASPSGKLSRGNQTTCLLRLCGVFLSHGSWAGGEHIAERPCHPSLSREPCLIALEAGSLGLQRPLSNSESCLSLAWLPQGGWTASLCARPAQGTRIQWRADMGPARGSPLWLRRQERTQAAPT